MKNRLEQFRANNKIQSAKYRKLVNNKFLFKLFLMKSLPMGFLAGLAVKSCDEKKCRINKVFAEARDVILQILENRTVKDII